MEATLRITPRPPVTRTLLAAFHSVPAAGTCVADIIAEGIVPAAMEFMDRRCIEAVEAYCAPGYPKSEAILIIEIDGLAADVADGIARVTEIACAAGAHDVHEAEDEHARNRLWRGRKAAFSAMGRLAPDMLCMDGTIPRRALPEVLARMAEMSEQYGLGFCNVFHAGDGNIHPLIIFDVMKEGELERAEAFGAEILRLCVAVGGVLTGEHGVGIEKRDLMPVMFSGSRSGPAAAPEMRVRFRRPAQSRQGVSDIVRLHRARACACEGRPHAPRRSATVLMARISVSSEADVVDVVRAARDSRRTLEIVGAGTKRGFGRPVECDDVLDLSGLRGIVKYEPDELVITARAGTPVAEIEAALAEKNQRLGFEPADWGPLFGAPANCATIGGVLSANCDGSAAIRYGRCRDHLLGFRAVNGFGEAYKGGGKVVKNVTGFDLPKLFCGAMGTLGPLTEVTLRVFPKRRNVGDLYGERSLLGRGAGVAATRFVEPAWTSTGLALFDGAAIVRLEGSRAGLDEKIAMLRELFPVQPQIADGDETFRDISSGQVFAKSRRRALADSTSTSECGQTHRRTPTAGVVCRLGGRVALGRLRFESGCSVNRQSIRRARRSDARRAASRRSLPRPPFVRR